MPLVDVSLPLFAACRSGRFRSGRDDWSAALGRAGRKRREDHFAGFVVLLDPARGRNRVPLVIARLAYLKTVVDECRTLAADPSSPVAARLGSLANRLESMMCEQDAGRRPSDTAARAPLS